MKTVIHRPMVSRWAPYQSADILREIAKAIRELDAEYMYDDDLDASEADDTDASDASSTSDGWESEAESTCQETTPQQQQPSSPSGQSV